jgi:DNA-binding CsgD family transcriptional regulator
VVVRGFSLRIWRLIKVGAAARRLMLVKTISSHLSEVQANAVGFCGDVFSTQRRLRSKLLDGGTIRYSRARDLAAHMLLNIDDLSNCWFIATNWLRTELSCQRLDTGFGAQVAAEYFPSFAEAKNGDYDVPSFGGSAVDNRDDAMQAMWLQPRPLIFADIKQDSRINIRLRQRLSGARTKSKFAGALRTGGNSYGLICADWTEHQVPRDSLLYDCFEYTVADVLSPIIAVAKEIADHNHEGWHRQWNSNYTSALTLKPDFLAKLTSSEIDIARLVAKGLSYKEIARIRGRSFSTIDHQLRSIRQKTGTASTSALISLLAKAEVPAQQ